MPKQLSKKDIKDVFVKSLEPFVKAVQTDFLKVNSQFDKVNARLDKVDSRLDSVDSRLNSVENEIREMRENSSELFSKLDKFIALYEKHEHELLVFGAQLRRLEERMSRLEAKQSHS